MMAISSSVVSETHRARSPKQRAVGREDARRSLPRKAPPVPSAPSAPSYTSPSSPPGSTPSTNHSSPKMDEESQSNWARWAGAMDQGAWLGEASPSADGAAGGADASYSTTTTPTPQPPMAEEYIYDDVEEEKHGAIERRMEGDDFVDVMTRTASLDERRADQRYSLGRVAMRTRLESAPEARHKRDRSHFSIPDVTVTTADDEGHETHFEVKVPASHRRSFVFKAINGDPHAGEDPKKVLGLGAARRAKGGVTALPKPLIHLDTPILPDLASFNTPAHSISAEADGGNATGGSSSASRMRKASLPLLLRRAKKSMQEEKGTSDFYGSSDFDSSSSLPSTSSSSSKDSLPSSSGGQTAATSPTSSETLAGPATKRAVSDTAIGTGKNGSPTSRMANTPSSRFSEADEPRPRSTTPTATIKAAAASRAALLAQAKREQKARAKEELALIKELERVDKMVRKHDEKRQKIEAREAREEKKREKKLRKKSGTYVSQDGMGPVESSIAVPIAPKENRAFKVLRKMTNLGSTSSNKAVALPVLQQQPTSILQRRRDDAVLPRVTVTPADIEAGWTNIPSPSDSQPLAPSAELTRRSSVQRALAKMDAERASLRRQNSKKHVVGGHNTPNKASAAATTSTPASASSRSSRRENSDGWEDDEGALEAGKRLQEAISLQQQIANEDMMPSEGRDGQITPRPRDYSMRRVREARSPTPEQQQNNEAQPRNVHTPEPVESSPVSFSRPFFTKTVNAYPSPPTSPTSPVTARSSSRQQQKRQSISPRVSSSASSAGSASNDSPPRAFKQGATPEGFTFPRAKSPTSPTAILPSASPIAANFDSSRYF